MWPTNGVLGLPAFLTLLVVYWPLEAVEGLLLCCCRVICVSRALKLHACVFVVRYLQIQSFPSGQGAPCLPTDQLVEARACAAVVTPCDLCANGVRDAFEVDIDCGGSCPKCKSGQTCSVDSDCDALLICSLASTCVCTFVTSLFCVVRLPLNSPLRVCALATKFTPACVCACH